MSNPTGKLKNAYGTITIMEAVIKTQEEKITSLEKENRKLKFIIEEGLGLEDLKRDF